jgi:hypothetical protein
LTGNRHPKLMEILPKVSQCVWKEFPSISSRNFQCHFKIMLGRGFGRPAPKNLAGARVWEASSEKASSQSWGRKRNHGETQHSPKGAIFDRSHIANIT